MTWHTHMCTLIKRKRGGKREGEGSSVSNMSKIKGIPKLLEGKKAENWR